MIRRDLSWIFLLPVKCRCGQETDYAVALIIEHGTLPCKHCGQNIVLLSEEWSVFRQGLGRALASVQPLYANIPD